MRILIIEDDKSLAETLRFQLEREHFETDICHDGVDGLHFIEQQAHDLILLEEIKTAYCPGFQKLLGIACSGSIGSIRNVEACFTKLEKADSRVVATTALEVSTSSAPIFFAIT